jgi:glycosyltransferase involved in cell wall biosynthesis
MGPLLAADTGTRSMAERLPFEPADVSVVIPTFNSAKTISWSLASVDLLDPPPKEVIVVDAISSDGTAEIADLHAKVISTDCSIPAARLIGSRAAKGRFVLNLDSDQAIEPTALRRAKEDGHEVIAFGESSVGRGLVWLVNDVDRRRLHRHWERQLDPILGTIRPRLFPRTTLIRALEAIPEQLLLRRPSPYSEDSLIYANSGVLPGAVGFVPNAVSHREMNSTWAYVRKWRTYGQAARPFRGTDLERFAGRRAARTGSMGDTIAGLPALILRAAPFFVGYYL